MLLRYSIPDSRVMLSTSSDAWPGKEPVSAFALTPWPRRFRVFIDAQSLGDSRAADIVSWLATDKAIRAWSNAAGIGCQIEERLEGSRSPTIVAGDAEVAIRQWDTWKPWVERSLAAGLRGDAIRRLPALMFSRLLGMDAFVTQCEGLISLRNEAKRFPAMVCPDEALAVVGLWKRLIGDHSYTLGPNATLSIGGLGYRVLAAEVLVPTLARLGVHSAPIERRLARALYARDRIHRSYFVDASDLNVVDEAFFYLDALLVQLVGAFDLLARYAHTKLGLKVEDVRKASWRGNKWQQDLRSIRPDLAKLTQASSRTGAVIDLCLLLRNYVHAEPLQPVEVVEASKSGKGVHHLNLPTVPKERSKLKNAMIALGGDWGTQWEVDEFLLVDVPTLTERLVACAARALEEIVIVLEPLDVDEPAPAAVQHLSDRLQPQVVEQSRFLLGLVPESWPD